MNRLVVFLSIILLSSCNLTPKNKLINLLPVSKILLNKSDRTLFLLDKTGTIIKKYSIKLGFNPKGHKLMEGDGKTPEGIYYISHHNPNSRYFKSLKISYPNEVDLKVAEALHVEPGGDIMIHGQENNTGLRGYFRHLQRDWTAGCIAVKDSEMQEIYYSVKDGTEIVILP